MNGTRFTRGALSLVLALLLVSQAVACGIFPEDVVVSDARVQPLLKAAAAFDRTKYGFSPLPASGRVRLESTPRAGYDAMLHLGGKTSRTIGFRKNASGYFWIGEQEIFHGPRTYTSVDGTFQEQITLTFEKEHVSGVPLNRLSIFYTGEDSRLAGHSDLSSKDVKPILHEWGY